MTYRFGDLRGFTLIEIAIVVFILGVLLAGLIGPIGTQIEARDRAQTMATMNGALEALYGFAITHGRLPCPAVDQLGVAAPTGGGACTQTEGWLPWVTLATAPGDAWGNLLRYRVSEPGFTTADDGVCSDTDNDFDLCEEGNIEIETRTDNKSTSRMADEISAIVVSYGRNAWGATSVQGVARGGPPAQNLDETENADSDADFLSRSYSAGDGDCSDTDASKPFCAFDDIVMWVSPAILNNRMVMAGRLP